MIDLWADDRDPPPSYVDAVCRIDGADVQCRILIYERALELSPRYLSPAMIEFNGHQCYFKSTMLRGNSMLLLFGEREFGPFYAAWRDEWRRVSKEAVARS